MDTLCISACNRLTTLPENLVGLSALRVGLKKDSYLRSCEDAEIYIRDLLNAFLTEVSANDVGKCSNLGLTSGSFKEAGEKTPHVVIKPFQIPVDEPPKTIVLSSRPLAEPSIFNCSPVSDSTIPSSSNSSSLWYLDSGAACHVCYSRASFESFVPTSDSFLFLPNGQTIHVGGTGSVRLCNDLTLQNVVFAPEFRWNLLSISALTQQHPYVVSFHSDGYVIEDPTRGRRIGIGRRADNLYTLDLNQIYFVSP